MASAKVDVPALARICARVRALVSLAKSASRMRLWLRAALLNYLMPCSLAK